MCLCVVPALVYILGKRHNRRFVFSECLDETSHEKIREFVHFEIVFSFPIRLLKVWENGKRKLKMTYFYPHFSALRVDRQKKGNGVILVILQVFFLF